MKLEVVREVGGYSHIPIMYQNAIPLIMIIWYSTQVPIPNRWLCPIVLVANRYTAYVILTTYLCFIMLNVLVLQLMNKSCMQGVSQLTIFTDVPSSLSVHRNHEFLVNTFSAQFVWNNKIILPACVVEILPTDVKVILPARFRVKTCFQVNVVLKCIDAFATLDRVNDKATFEWVSKSATHVWVNTYDQVNLASEWANMFIG